MDYAYEYVDGALERVAVNWDVPAWSTEGTGPHSVANNIETWRPVVADGGMLVGAYEDDELAGLAIVVPEFEPPLAWLAFLHVTAPHRSTGVGTALWLEAEDVSRRAGASQMYVSATSSGPTIDFYLSRGCTLAVDPHPGLYDKEPDDIHFVRQL